MSRWEEDLFDTDEIEQYELWTEEGYNEEHLERTSPTNRRKSSSRQPTESEVDWYGFDPYLGRFCEHPPRCVLKSQAGGWSVFAGAAPDCQPSIGEYDLLLNLTGNSFFAGHAVSIPELARWQRPSPVPEIVLAWPDMGVVHLPREFWMDLVRYLALKRAKLLVFCMGGHGRTGTAVACIMTVCGWESSDAIAWVRTNYCPRAIETKQQEDYVRRVAGEIPDTAVTSHSI